MKRALAACVSLVLLAVLLWRVGASEALLAVAGAHLGWFSLAMLMFLPQIALIAWRWQRIAEPFVRLSWRESARQVVASNTLNLVLPSKLGDLAKAKFASQRGHCTLGEGVQAVVFEKVLDLAALCVWMWVGWLLRPRFEWWLAGVLAIGLAIPAAALVIYARPARGAEGGRGGKVRAMWDSGPALARRVSGEPGRMAMVLASSLGIWFLHLAQVAMLFAAVRGGVGAFEVFAVMPAAILAGLMPLTVAGLGVRDWAIVVLFARPETAASTFAAVGLLVSLRYVVPAAAGLPYFHGYLRMAMESRARKRPKD